jgi:carboxyl-terminal processing protease
MLENNIGYIDFDSFTETSYSEFKEAYEDLKSNGATSLIIDLRDNTGGQVDQVLKIADLFIESGKTILITEDKNGNRINNNSRTDKVIDMPVVVLVNDYTASASEILTGFLKDYNLATVVGVKTYGKGVIQNVYTNIFGEDSGVGLKITVAEYYTPNGNRVHHEGIEPDEVVEETTNQNGEEKSDLQLNKAIEILKK